MEAPTYFGFYEFVQDVTEEESKYLSSSASVVGSAVSLIFGEDEDGNPQVRVESARKRSLGHFSPEVSARLTRLKQEDFVCCGFLSAVAYTEATGMFFGEYALICYSSDESEIWEHYGANLKARIACGDHPDMRLGTKNLERVIESNGAWCLNKSMPYKELDKGTVYYKKKRTWTDALIDLALDGKVGCKIGTWIFYIVLAAAIVYFVWRWFFAG